MVLAGGRYITEDNWVSPGYPGCDWLFFQRTADGSLVFLWHDMINDMGPYSLAYGQYLEQRLAQLDFDIGSVSFAALDAARKLEYMMDHSGGQITLMLTPPEGEGTACTVSPDSGNSRYYQQRFTDPEAYRWSYVDSFPGYPEGTFLTITDPTWDYFIRLWEDSDLVMIKESNAGAVWYRAESVALPPDDVFYYRTLIFNFMRGWFDEAEWTALTGGIAIPDEGQSRQAIAQAWVDAYEGAKLRTTPGGHYTCTYIKNIQVKAEETAETPESWFPEEILPYDHFRFSYSTIFVPENTDAQNYMMAGNTAEYEGDDPGVPAGAFQHWLIGAMYLRTDTGTAAALEQDKKDGVEPSPRRFLFSSPFRPCAASPERAAPYTAMVRQQTMVAITAPKIMYPVAGICWNHFLCLFFTNPSATLLASSTTCSAVTPPVPMAPSFTMKMASSKKRRSGDFTTMTRRLIPLSNPAPSFWSFPPYYGRDKGKYTAQERHICPRDA